MAQHMSGPPSLAGQVALITGGSGGMGRAIAQVFNGAGARVVATDLSKHGDLGTRIEYRRCDVTSRVETDQVIDGMLADHGKVDILVLCAGIIARTPLSTSTAAFRVRRHAERPVRSGCQAGLARHRDGLLGERSA
jgi:3-oxoacyl-[acyl-carrier protein] reductase